MALQASTTKTTTRTVGRGRTVLSGLLTTALTGALLGGAVLTAAPATAATGPECVRNTDARYVDCTQTFTYTGAEEAFTVPVGVTKIDVTTVGAPGGKAALPTSRLGGRGGVATIQDWLVPEGVDTLFVAVGGKGPNRGDPVPIRETDAFNGGTHSASFGPLSVGGGGGGASDIRTVTRTQPDTLGSRLVVGGGGGGGGGDNGNVIRGGTGGDADAAGSPGDSSLPLGGGAGTQTEGGAGGGGGDHNGTPGTFGSGANATPFFFTGSSNRGQAAGGGGGWYGGGSSAATGNGNSGGGGGGSSYAPGGITGVAADITVPPSVTISWQEDATFTVNAPITVGANEEFPVSAFVFSASLPPTDVTADTQFAIDPSTAGSCTAATCVVTVGGQVNVTGTFGTLAGSMPVTVGSPATITGTPPAATLNTPYQFTYTIGGDPAPVLSVTSGALPAGLSLSQDGTLSGTPTTPGTVSFTITADNGFDPPAMISSTVQVGFVFGGFRSPVDAPPVVNTVKAGSNVPVKFSLGGDFGLNILAAGSPTFVTSSCTGGVEDPVTTVTTSNSGLTYDPATGVYQYNWKTAKSDAGKCGTFTLTLTDGSTHQLLFRLK